ncbi:DUF6088 family protein [Candidatus Palauibacter sp.]|uniref:DUF6088 family protein n=1 Tax=Candidatus Palauibacter sp. TaxID=3101350 RepID=UPI003B51F9F2
MGATSTEVCGQDTAPGRTPEGDGWQSPLRDLTSYWLDRPTCDGAQARDEQCCPKRIIESAEAKPEATPIQADDLLHLGDRAAVVRSLSRLVHSERLLRICRGVYMRPIQTRFGLRAPRLEKALASLSALWARSFAANWLGLTTQNTVRSIYLTSGPDRLLHFGGHRVELRHAPAWQLTAPHRPAGVAIRALAWLGPDEVERSLDAVFPQLSGEAVSDLAAARDVMPGWMAEPLNRRLVHG